ncbi:MAG: tetratricopeptide repeat protein [Pontiellaceae bacterium]|nr:tetratricopeptide repeat protein [Pontiellaceae bacterium]MBN2783546.1 tetratricopeptide repeat protein [Pontiellaceae bacterium]
MLVRKNPRDPQSFALLAAAQARHLEFDQAVRYIGKAASLESRPDESALLEVRRAAYREGEPFPPVATESWMLAAVDKQLHWAIDRMLWKLSEQTHPDYNPDLAIQVCRGLVEEGDRDKYYLLGNLYLNMGRLDEAMDCFNLFNDSRMQGKTKEKHRDMDHYRMIESEDLERMLQIAEKIEKGFTESFTQSGDPDPFYGSRETYTVSRQNPANLKGAYFIYRIAAQKGSQVAREKVDEIEYNRAAYRRIIDNEKKLSNKAVARALEVEAKKFMQGMELPEDGELALGIFLEAYLLDPLPDYAAFIGELSVRNKGVKEAIRWWEIAAEGKILTAYTSLLRYYACAEDDGLLNPEKAMRYARAYVDAAPESAEAQSYLACAYARDGKFPRATQIMEDVLKQSEDTSLDIKERYEKQYRFFKSRKPWVWEE